MKASCSPKPAGDQWIAHSTAPPSSLRSIRPAKGSGVTRIERLVMHPTHKNAMLGKLKKALGCGGTLKDGTFEFQGDHRDKLEKLLLADGYKVKCIGGA